MPYDGLVLVTGASGNLGRRIVQALQQHDIGARALVRRPDKAELVDGVGATISVGDMKIPADMRRAVNGARAVISAAGVAVARGPDTPMSVDFQGNLNLINAAIAAGLEHFVLISVVGADWLHASDIFLAKRKAEQELRASGLRYTILRAGGLMNDYQQAWQRSGRRGAYVTIGSADKPLALISPDDLAQLAVRSLWTPAAFNRTFNVANTESRLTPREVAATFSEVFDKPVRLRTLPIWPLKALRWGLKPIRPGIADFMGFLQAVGSNVFEGEGEKIEEIYDYRLESYAEFLKRTRE